MSTIFVFHKYVILFFTSKIFYFILIFLWVWYLWRGFWHTGDSRGNLLCTNSNLTSGSQRKTSSVFSFFEGWWQPTFHSPTFHILTIFYRGPIKSILSSCVTGDHNTSVADSENSWEGHWSISSLHHRHLQHVVILDDLTYPFLHSCHLRKGTKALKALTV